MKKIVAKIVCLSGIFIADIAIAKAFIPAEIPKKEYLKMKSDCKIQSEKDLKQINSYGINDVKLNWLTMRCINSAAEIYIYNNDNAGKTPELVYEEALNKVNTRIDELKDKTDDFSKAKVTCYNYLNLSMSFAIATQDQDFVNRAIISYYISAKNDCNKKNYY